MELNNEDIETLIEGIKALSKQEGSNIDDTELMFKVIACGVKRPNTIVLSLEQIENILNDFEKTDNKEHVLQSQKIGYANNLYLKVQR